jgi:hypothetical protein
VTGNDKPESGVLTLVDYVLVALLNLGGDAAPVDVEDVAVEAMRLSPQRFRWRKYDYPSLEWVRVSLNDANNKGAQLVIRGSNRYERMLTAEGSRRARELSERLGAGAPTHASNEVLRRKANAELARLEGHPAFSTWREQGWARVDAIDLADLARCSLSTAPSEFQRRLLRLEAEAAAWGRDDLKRFLGEAAARLPDMINAAGAH